MVCAAFCQSALTVLLWSTVAAAIKLDLSSQVSIKSVAGTIAFDMMSSYKGNLSGQIPGILPGPPPRPAVTDAGYFWWEAGAMWGSMIDYWYYTGDSSYNDVIEQGILFQVGDNRDFLPLNQSIGMGNDDQGFWGMTAMTAAELGFQNPPAEQPQWLALAQAVFNTQTTRLDKECGGGLHWQAFRSLNGFDYKNSISNGCYFNIAARLARYTGNTTYLAAAETTWDWVRNVGFIDENYAVYDGAHAAVNCTDIVKIQYSYNAGIFLHGLAVMYNQTAVKGGVNVWTARLDGLLNATLETFFTTDNIAYEIACEDQLTCNIDMLSMKAYLTKWMAATAQLAPWTHDRIFLRLNASAAAAALQCSGGPNGRMCGLSWSKGAVWDGTSGVGQQMAALEVIQSNIVLSAPGPLTNETGGTSVGDPNAGSHPLQNQDLTGPTTTGDRVGAGIVTAVVLAGFIGTIVWIVI